MVIIMTVAKIMLVMLEIIMIVTMVVIIITNNYSFRTVCYNNSVLGKQY